MKTAARWIVNVIALAVAIAAFLYLLAALMLP